MGEAGVDKKVFGHQVEGVCGGRQCWENGIVG